MKKLVFVLAALMSLPLLASQEIPRDLIKAKAELDERFTYQEDRDDLDIWTKLPRKGKVFGDCEDYALAIKREAGGRIWAGITRLGEGHVMICKEGYCAGTLTKGIKPFNPKRYTWLMMMNEQMINKKLKDSKGL